MFVLVWITGSVSSSVRKRYGGTKIVHVMLVAVFSTNLGPSKLPTMPCCSTVVEVKMVVVVGARTMVSCFGA